MGESPISIAVFNAGTIAFSPFPLVKLLGCPVLSHAQLPNSLVYNPFKLVGYMPPKKQKSIVKVTLNRSTAYLESITTYLFVNHQATEFQDPKVEVLYHIRHMLLRTSLKQT